jgi:hypothetical protein
VTLEPLRVTSADLTRRSRRPPLDERFLHPLGVGPMPPGLSPKLSPEVFPWPPAPVDRSSMWIWMYDVS